MYLQQTTQYNLTQNNLPRHKEKAKQEAQQHRQGIIRCCKEAADPTTTYNIYRAYCDITTNLYITTDPPGPEGTESFEPQSWTHSPRSGR